MQPDEQLVTLALRGSASAADDLVRRHWPGCWRIAYGIVVSADDADEVAQEAIAGLRIPSTSAATAVPAVAPPERTEVIVLAPWHRYTAAGLIRLIESLHRPRRPL